MNISKIGKRYAKALFEFALEQNNLEEVMKDMDLVNNTINQSLELQRVLRNPVMHNNTKKAAMKAVFEKHIGETVMKYLLIIIQKNRETFIHEIAHQFVEYYKKYKNIKTAYLKTADKVDDDIRKAVIETLEEQTQAEIELIEEIQEELIGGLVLNVGDMEMDLSVRRRITELARDFKVNIYQGKF